MNPLPLPPPWNYVAIATGVLVVIAAADFTVSRRAGSRPLSPLQRLLLYGGVTLLAVAFEAFPQLLRFFTWAGLAMSAAIVVLICLLLALLQYYISSANRILRSAQRLAAEGRIPAAITLLATHADRQARRDPLFGALLHSEMARLHGQQKEWRSADAALDRAFSLVPQNPLLFYIKAEVLRQRGDVHEALQLVESVRSEFPHSAPLQTTYSELLVEHQQWEAAEREVDKLARLLDAKECEGVIDRSEWRATRLQPLRHAIQHRQHFASPGGA